MYCTYNFSVSLFQNYGVITMSSKIPLNWKFWSVGQTLEKTGFAALPCMWLNVFLAVRVSPLWNLKKIILSHFDRKRSVDCFLCKLWYSTRKPPLVHLQNSKALFRGSCFSERMSEMEIIHIGTMNYFGLPRRSSFHLLLNT